MGNDNNKHHNKNNNNHYNIKNNNNNHIENLYFRSISGETKKPTSKGKGRKQWKRASGGGGVLTQTCIMPKAVSKSCVQSESTASRATQVSGYLRVYF